MVATEHIGETMTEEMLERIRRDAWEDGYHAALEKVRMVPKLAKLGLPDCEIVKRTDLPPVIVHGMMGGH